MSQYLRNCINTQVEDRRLLYNLIDENTQQLMEIEEYSTNERDLQEQLEEKETELEARQRELDNVRAEISNLELEIAKLKHLNTEQEQLLSTYTQLENDIRFNNAIYSIFATSFFESEEIDSKYETALQNYNTEIKQIKESDVNMLSKIRTYISRVRDQHSITLLNTIKNGFSIQNAINAGTLFWYVYYINSNMPNSNTTDYQNIMKTVLNTVYQNNFVLSSDMDSLSQRNRNQVLLILFPPFTATDIYNIINFENLLYNDSETYVLPYYNAFKSIIDVFLTPYIFNNSKIDITCVINNNEQLLGRYYSSMITSEISIVIDTTQRGENLNIQELNNTALKEFNNTALIQYIYNYKQSEVTYFNNIQIIYKIKKKFKVELEVNQEKNCNIRIPEAKDVEGDVTFSDTMKQDNKGVYLLFNLLYNLIDKKSADDYRKTWNSTQDVRKLINDITITLRNILSPNDIMETEQSQQQTQLTTISTPSTQPQQLETQISTLSTNELPTQEQISTIKSNTPPSISTYTTQ